MGLHSELRMPGGREGDREGRGNVVQMSGSERDMILCWGWGGTRPVWTPWTCPFSCRNESCFGEIFRVQFQKMSNHIS